MFSFNVLLIPKSCNHLAFASPVPVLTVSVLKQLQDLGYMVSFSKEVKIMLQAKLSSKFQISIPKALRYDLNLQAGQQFTLIARGTIIELIPVRSIENAKGMLSSPTPQDSSEYRDRAERDV